VGMNRNTIAHTDTSGTISSSILDTPAARASRNRLSFLKRHTREPSLQQHEAVLAPVINGGNVKKESGLAIGRGRGKDDSSSERSRSKENRKSFFSSSGGLGSIGRGRGREISEKDEEMEWVTQSDLAGAADSARRSSSSQRPMTGKSGLTKEGSRGGTSQRGDSLSRDGSMGSRVGGSVRKRFSMLKLGKKSSKASVLVDSVAEED